MAPGVIESPNYPDNYPDDTRCRKTLMAPMNNNIRLTINDFRLEPSLDCSWDYLSIYDSSSGRVVTFHSEIHICIMWKHWNLTIIFPNEWDIKLRKEKNVHAESHRIRSE